MGELTTTTTRDITPISTTKATDTSPKPRSLLPPPRPTTTIDTTAIIGTTDTIDITDTATTIDIDTTTEDEYRRLIQPSPPTIRSAAASAEVDLMLNLGCRLE